MRFLIITMILICPTFSQGWGFFAHKKINRLAVFTLPTEMLGFYKYHIQYLTVKSVNPDMRRYIDKMEAPRHYIDLDVYGDSALYQMPRYWDDAVVRYTEDTLQAYGIVPYHIKRITWGLIQAFKDRKSDQILRLSADLGHYIADAHVPLHTTENYNGQLSGQLGIHGLWESRLPELFFEEYDLLTGQATYIEDLQLHAWQAITYAHLALDSVLRFEKELTKKYSPSKKYGYEDRGISTIRTYSYEFSRDYHRRLSGMVERRMRASIKMIGDFWLSCWVKAGQPNLDELINMKLGFQEEDSVIIDKNLKLRDHEIRN